MDGSWGTPGGSVWSAGNPESYDNEQLLKKMADDAVAKSDPPAERRSEEAE